MTRKKPTDRFQSGLQMAVVVVTMLSLLVSLIDAENIAMFTDNLLQNYRSILVNQTYYIDGILNNTSLVDRYESNKYCLLSTIATAASSMSTSQSIVKSLIQYSNYSRNTFESKKVKDKCFHKLELWKSLRDF